MVGRSKTLTKYLHCNRAKVKQVTFKFSCYAPFAAKLGLKGVIVVLQNRRDDGIYNRSIIHRVVDSRIGTGAYKQQSWKMPEGRCCCR